MIRLKALETIHLKNERCALAVWFFVNLSVQFVILSNRSIAFAQMSLYHVNDELI